jgi:hypothetical protein
MVPIQSPSARQRTKRPFSATGYDLPATRHWNADNPCYFWIDVSADKHVVDKRRGFRTSLHAIILRWKPGDSEAHNKQNVGH